MKSVQIGSFFWSGFSCIQSKYRKIRTRKNSLFGNFSRSATMLKIPIMESYLRIKIKLKVWSFCATWLFCKSHSIVGIIKIPNKTKWHFQWYLYSKANFCLSLSLQLPCYLWLILLTNIHASTWYPWNSKITAK